MPAFFLQNRDFLGEHAADIGREYYKIGANFEYFCAFRSEFWAY